MTTFALNVITRDNDLTLSVGPIKGRDPADNTVKNWTGIELQAWIVADPASDTPLGGVTLDVDVIGATATFVPSFDAPQVNTILDAAATALTPGGPLPDGQRLYCILKAAEEFRVAVPLTYRTARVTA